MMHRAIVTGGTKEDIAAIGVLAINLRKTNKDLFDELVIFHDGIKKKDMEIINRIFPSRFLRYEYPNKSRNDEIVTYFSYMVFCKYECFRLLSDYDVVTWTDYDVVILDRLDEIVQFGEERLIVLSDEKKVRDNFYKEIHSAEVLEFELDAEAVSTPIFSVSNRLENYLDICDWCYQKTVEWDEDLYLPEQCIFGTVVQKFNIPMKRIPGRRYVTYPEKVVGDEIIIHAGGQPKFWNGRDDERWNAMYSEWLKRGGSKYHDRIKKMKNRIRFIISRLRGVRGREH